MLILNFYLIIHIRCVKGTDYIVGGPVFYPKKARQDNVYTVPQYLKQITKLEMSMNILFKINCIVK